MVVNYLPIPDGYFKNALASAHYYVKNNNLIDKNNVRKLAQELRETMINYEKTDHAIITNVSTIKDPYYWLQIYSNMENRIINIQMKREIKIIKPKNNKNPHLKTLYLSVDGNGIWSYGIEGFNLDLSSVMKDTPSVSSRDEFILKSLNNSQNTSGTTTPRIDEIKNAAEIAEAAEKDLDSFNEQVDELGKGVDILLGWVNKYSGRKFRSIQEMDKKTLDELLNLMSDENKQKAKNIIDKSNELIFAGKRSKSVLDSLLNFRQSVIPKAMALKTTIGNLDPMQKFAYYGLIAGAIALYFQNKNNHEDVLDEIEELQHHQTPRIPPPPQWNQSNNREIESKIAEIERKIDLINSRMYRHSTNLSKNSMTSRGGSKNTSTEKYSKKINYAHKLLKQLSYMNDLKILSKLSKAKISMLLEKIKINTKGLKKVDMINILRVLSHTKHGSIYKLHELKIVGKILSITNPKNKSELKNKIQSRLRRLSLRIK